MRRIALLFLVGLMLIALILPGMLAAEDEPAVVRGAAYAAGDGSPIVYENHKVANVEEAFANLTHRGEWMGFNLGLQPAVQRQLELFPPPFDSHIQGMARSPRVGQAPVFYMAVSGTPEDEDSYAALLVVQMGSRAQHGERLGSNRLQQGKETTSTFPDPGLGRDRVVKIIEYPYQKHPSGISMVGDILAVPNGGNSAVRKGAGEIRVMFYDCSDPLNPVEMPEVELLLKAGNDVPKLFTLPNEVQQYMDYNNTTQAYMADLFQQLGGIDLGYDATITQYGARVWLITDGEKKYALHLEEKDSHFYLNVYHAWEKPLILGLEHESALNSLNLSETLQDALATVHVVVGDDAVIKENGEDSWLIEDTVGADEVVVYTIEKKGKYLHVYGAPVKPPWSDGAQGVGITKLPATAEYPDGRFLLVRNTGNKAHYHWSNQGTFSEGLMWTDYQELSTERRYDLSTTPPTRVPDLEVLLTQGYWQDSKPRFQNLTFVDQADGALYLIGAINTEGFSPAITMFGEDELYLIKLHNQDQPGNLTMTAALDSEKMLRSPGQRRYWQWPTKLFEDRWYYFEEYWLSIPWPPDWLGLVLGTTLDLDAVKPMSKRTQANFNAGATAYVTPSGELLYYGVHHWADGNPGKGTEPWTLHGPDSFQSKDYVKMAELAHENVAASGTCGDPQFRNNHLGGPYIVQDPSRGVDIYGEVYSVEPWVRMYEDDDYAGHMVLVDYEWQGADDYDIFKYLDGGYNECRDRYYDDPRGGWDGFSNCMSSFRWCGPSGATLTFFDNARHKPCSKSSCKDDLVLTGNGSAFSQSLQDNSFKEEADSVLLDWTPPAENYAWQVSSGAGSLVADCRNPAMTHYYPGIDSTTDTVQLTYTRDAAVHVFTTDIKNEPPDPGFISLKFDNRCPETGQAINLDGAWTISASQPVTPTISVDWGDGVTDTGSSPRAESFNDPYRGSFAFTHHYTAYGTYTVQVCAEGAFAGFCDQHQIEVEQAPFLLVPINDREIDEGGVVIGRLARYLETGGVNIEEATINWGDKTGDKTGQITDLGGGRGEIHGSHIYADDGVYRVLVCVQGNDDSNHCGTFVVTVNNVDPSGLEAGADRVVDEGALVQLGPVRVSDPGYDCTSCEPETVESFTATIDWGDGNQEPTEEIIIERTPGGFTIPTSATITAEHHYADNGRYDVEICVMDDDEGQICDGFAVDVNNVQPSLDAGPDQVVYEGDVVNLDLATFSDPGFDCAACGTVEDFTATIDWGSGSELEELAVSETPGGEAVLTTGGFIMEKMVLAPPGHYSLTLCVADDEGAQACDAVKVQVLHGFLRLCAYGNSDRFYKDDGISSTRDYGVYYGLGAALFMARQATADCALSYAGVPGQQRSSGIGARGPVRMQSEVVVSGEVLSLGGNIYVGKTGQVSGPVTADGNVTVSKYGLVDNDIASGGRVYVQKYATVNGNISAAGRVWVDRRAEVAGRISRYAEPPMINPITWVELHVQPGRENVTVGRGERALLNEGAYRDLRVRRDGQLTLTSGHYRFRSIKLERGARLLIDLAADPGTIVIDVAGRVEMQRDVQMAFVAAGEPEDILFRVARRSLEDNYWGSAVRLDRRGHYLGTFLVPYGTIRLGEEARLEGALYGRRVRIGREATIIGKPARDLFAEE